jgi:hypothetical protein
VANEAVLILVVSGSFVWAAYLCFDMSRISKEFDGSMLMGVIFYPCQHHGCLMSRTCEVVYIPDHILISCFRHRKGTLALQFLNERHHYIEENKEVRIWSMN